MTPEEQQIAIAMICGWTRRPATLPGNIHEWNNPEGHMSTRNSMPDYLNDLDAMHEAEKMLTNDRLWFMGSRLGEIVPVENPISHATAAERARAFLESYDKFLGEDDE